MASRFYSTLICLSSSALVLGASACNKKEDSPSEAAASEANPSASPSADPSVSTGYYAKQYCESIGKLKVKNQPTSEFGFFCKGSEPTKAFLTAFAAASDQAGGEAIKITPVSIKHNEDTGFSDIQMLWYFKAPIGIPEFRNKDLAGALTKALSSATVEQTATAEKQPDSALQHPLHISSVKLKYTMVLKALKLQNQRTTEYNLYQVKGGDEHMGLAVETLIDEVNNDYQKATMVNVSLSPNGGKSGSAVINLLSFSLANRTFPKTAEDTITEIANNAAKAMVDTLK